MSEVEGRIESGKWIQTHLSRVLLQLERGRRTGALHLTAAEVTQLVIVEGQIVFAEAPEDTALLFERLVNEGSLEPISARRIERRVAEAPSWSGIVRAAELVIQDARVAPNMLQQALLATIHHRVASCFRTFDGAWIFRDDPRASGVPRYPIVLEATLVEALSEGEAAARIREILGGYGSRFPRLEKESGVGTTKYLLTPGRYRVLRLVDGTRTLDEILQQSALGANEGASLIAAFTMLERIWWAMERTAAPVMGDSAPEGRRMATIERAPTPIREARLPVPPPSERAPSREVGMHTLPRASERARHATPSTPVDMEDLLKRLRPRTRSGETEIQAPTARAHFDRGKTHFDAGRHVAAGTEFDKAVALEPANANYVLHARFVAFTQAPITRRKELEVELIELVTKYVKDNKADAFALHVIGRIAFENNDMERALKAFKASERIFPEDSENVRYLRLVAARTKR